ncbi:MAG: DEAD/DEAH box helicase [Desulfurococcales archaeon]|nr:DEAD/DEAH box helicase [Desulfurococcales archaeon]
MQDALALIDSTVRSLGGRIAYRHIEESTDPPRGPSPREAGLPDALARSLEELGIKSLYLHQYRALEAFRAGGNLVIVSGTGTGKTEAFLIPIAEALIREGSTPPRPYALILYPTKALARDQLYRIKIFLEGALGYRVEVLDGDTPQSKREEIYIDPPHILISNPDMLHYGMAFSEKFRDLVSRVRVVVLDEMHVYGGVFGAHVRWILYRLRRLAGGRRIRFIGAGATIGNPSELAAQLFGESAKVVEGPRRRRGRAIHLLVEQGRASRWTLAAAIIASLARQGLKVVGFADSQQMAELIARIARRSFGVQVLVHRAGLLPGERRRIEEGLRSGDVKAVVATSTLELGIDIGDLDAVIMSKLPRSFSSYLQRAGRAGRRGRPGLVATILGDDPIESYFLARPREFFSQEPDPAYIEPSNIEVARVHAAALMLQEGLLDPEGLPDPMQEALEELAREGAARLVERRYYPDWRRVRGIVENSSIRSSGPMVRIYDISRDRRGVLIGYRELPQALYDLYPGAIYYHGGRGMVSVRLDVNALRADVRPLGGDVGFYTKPFYTVDVVALKPLKSRYAGPVRVIYAELILKVIVEGYTVREEYSGTLINEVRYQTPLEWRYRTLGIMLKYPDPGFEKLTDAISAYHALEHVLISASKPVVGASDTDLGGISYPTGHIVIYDSAPGGHGASKLVFERLEKVHEVARRILSQCTCEDGCPRCVFSPYCGSGNRFLSRRGALKVLIAVEKGIKVEPSKPRGRPLA